MMGGSSSRSEQLDALLDEALELDAEAWERFLDTVDPELREDLALLLRADSIPCPLDGSCADLIEVALSAQGDAPGTVAAGEQIGSYRRMSLLGEGGMASVWLAERVDGRFNHQVAVKCLRTGLATPESRTRFLLEQQIMAQLHHPYIARLYDAGVTGDNVPFIVMEWIDGLSLTRYCDDLRLGVIDRLQLFLKVCAAVAHAHQNLVVHRDLKPGNILVGSDGEPRLLDFGIAKQLDESAPVTQTGMRMLTPEYAAPEQFGSGVITTATDGYMLGAVLYELLCGRRPRRGPFHRESADEEIVAPSDALRSGSRTLIATPDAEDPEQLATNRGIALERLRRTLRGDLDTIVLKALQTDPQRRYATVQAFSEDIGRYLRQQPIAARKDSRAYSAGKFLQRHAVAVALGALVAAALLTATTVSIYQARRAQTEARRAQIEARRAQIEARHALATKKFLTDLFEVSDAGVPREQMPTAQTLLQDGVKRIHGEFGDAPEVKFDLLLMLGRVQLHLGQYAPAASLLKEALAIADANFTPDNVEWLQAHTWWAQVLQVQSHFAQAAQQQSAAIAAHRHAGGADSDALTIALTVLAGTYVDFEQFDQAVATSRQAVDVAKRLHGERHSEVQKAQEYLSWVLLRAGRLDEAESISRANVALSGQLYGERNAKYANSLTVLAEALQRKNNYIESERIARQALAIEETVYDRPNAALIDTLSALTYSIYHQEKLDDSEAVLQRWLAAQTQLTAPGDPSTAPVLFNLGLNANRRHAHPEAERIFRQALAIYDKRPGTEPPSLETDTWRALADELVAQQRLPEAMAAVRQALAIDRGSFGNDGQRVGSDLTESSLVETKLGHLPSALEQIDDALRILGKVAPVNDPDADDARIQKAAILNRLARYDEAKSLLMAMIPRLRRAASDYDSRERLSRGLTELGNTQAGTGDARAALANWNEALSLQLAMTAPDPRDVGELRGLIAKTREAPQKPKQ